MKVAVISDIHDNLARWSEAREVCQKQKISTAICCGDVGSPETLEEIAGTFDLVYLALGNADFRLKQNPELIPGNVRWFEAAGAFELKKRKIAIVHQPDPISELAGSGKYDLVFYGHTHTPWEKKIGRTEVINPGEIAGQFGPASFCLFDLATMKGELKIIK